MVSLMNFKLEQLFNGTLEEVLAAKEALNHQRHSEIENEHILEQMLCRL